MDDSRFWDIIESAGPTAPEDTDRRLESIRGRLAGLSPEELSGFQAVLDRKMAESYRWDLWGAAYVINGGCSDDGFFYFRAWLISRGRSAFEAALRDPDSLANEVDPDRDDYEFEELWGVAREVYTRATGEEMPPGDADEPADPVGEGWDFDDDEQVTRRLPGLAAMYL